MNRSLSRIHVSLIALTLVVLSTITGCANKPKTVVTVPDVSVGDKLIQDAKKYGPKVSGAIQEAFNQEAALLADGTIDADMDKAVHPWLEKGKKVTDDFNARAAKWEHFDPSNRTDVTKLLKDLLGFVDNAYREGVLKIKNPQKQQIASGILSGLKVVLLLWQEDVQ